MTAQTRCFVLFVIDGMRPDGLQQAKTPHLDKLIANGTHTLTAQTVMPSMTLPCHMSLFHSVPPTRHGITTNQYTPQVRPVPGLFDVLQQYNCKTAFFHSWETLRDLNRPEALDVSFMVKYSYDDEANDRDVSQMAARWLGSNPFNFAFVYLGGTDTAGHKYSWMSDGYLHAIEFADSCIGTVLEALPSDCAILVTADHGGHDQTHGTDSAEDMTIPIILSGGGFTPDTPLPANAQITDIAPTITHYFDIPTPHQWIGTPLA